MFCWAFSYCYLIFQMQLPNRLCKMLAPLHWRDYEKKYGKLEDFVAGHPEVRFSRTLMHIKWFFIYSSVYGCKRGNILNKN